MRNPQKTLADIAAEYLGAHETGDNRAGDDPRMKEIFAADTIPGDGYPWCCSFVSLCVQRLAKDNPDYELLHVPRTASVAELANVWATNESCLRFHPGDKDHFPQVGDIFTLATVSHCGIVGTVDFSSGVIGTIEGNTNKAGEREGREVMRKDRFIGQVRWFIRLPVRGQRTEKRHE